MALYNIMNIDIENYVKFIGVKNVIKMYVIIVVKIEYK